MESSTNPKPNSMGRDPSGSSKDRRASESRARDAKHKRSRKRKDYSSSDLKSDVSSDTNHSPRRWEPTEEEINEYMAKKAQRKAMKVARKMKTQTVSGYSNDSNPFGDSNLTEKFVWRKKIERDVSRGISLKDLSVKAEKQRQKRRMGEIEKVKKRREERAMEKARREEEMAMLARERARAEFQDWEQKEEEFHFGQSKARAEIRLKEGRAKPIDVLSKNLNLSTEFDVEITEPYKIYKGLTVKELEELRQDIKMHLELDRATPTHIEFWEAMMIVCEWEISEARKRDALDRARVRGEAPPPELVAEDMGLHDSVAVDVTNKLERMSFINLEKWQEKIESDMRSGTAKVVEFWEVLLKRLHIYKAKAHLREIHADLLHQHLLRQHSSGEMKVSEQKVEHVESSDEDPDSYSPVVETEDKEEHNEAESFSPELLHAYEGDEVVEPEADKEELQRRRAEVLEEQRRRLQGAASGAEDDMELTGQERALVLKAMGGMEEGDAILGSNAEVNIESQVYWWHDKYRPRKPKYFNRVHTGYEWNKYNQTHYDHDNPPPKIVQGYKFNIFYPDLVDKSKTPKYVIEADGSNGETCVIRFHAGPPYEDVAFRIVNKEWEYSHKKGFKCTFERGILHVYINFQRYRYRR